MQRGEGVINTKDMRGQTPLMTAAAVGNLPMVEALVGSGLAGPRIRAVL